MKETSSVNHTNPATPPGLTSVEAGRRLQQLGPNAVAEGVSRWWQILLTKFWGPVPWMLELAILLQLALRV